MDMKEFLEIKQQPHISASSLQTYMTCGLQYKFSRVDKLKPAFTADNLVFGSTVHKVLQEFYQERMVGNNLDAEELQRLWAKYWDESEAALDNDRIQYSAGKDFVTLSEEGRGLLAAFHEALPEEDNNRIISIEQPFVCLVEDAWPLIGITDLIEEDEAGNLIVTDWKSSARAYSSGIVDGHQQLTIYFGAMQANGYENREILLKLHVLIKTKVPKCEAYYTTRTDDDWNRAVKLIQQVCEGIQKSVFIPNTLSYRCSNCSYKCYCDQWFNES